MNLMNFYKYKRKKIMRLSVKIKPYWSEMSNAESRVGLGNAIFNFR